MPSPLAIQWSLDQTANSSLSISRGLIAAATSDNVEPFAVAACEKFGATLSICRDSCSKVERLVEPKTPIATFLGAYIGYSVGDCATQLVKTVAGVQFMALASALVTSIGASQGAAALEMLLERSAVDKTQVPPVGMLKPLLQALEPRCIQLRFLDSVIYFRNLLQSQESTESDQFWKKAVQYPDADGIAKLVHAISQQQRAQLTNSGSGSYLEFKAGNTAPWVIAFISWVLGGFSWISFHDGYTTFTSKAPLVTITAVIDRNVGLEIMFHSHLDKPSDLIVCRASSESWSGMVSITAYGRSLRNDFDLNSADAIQCLGEILPYAVRQSVALMRPSDIRQRNHDFNMSHQHHPLDNSLHPVVDDSLLSLLAIPFGQDANISKVISLMLYLSPNSPPLHLKSLPDGVLIADLPAAQKYLAKLKIACICVRCNSLGTNYTQCHLVHFWRGVVSLIKDILCLSLFENLDDLAVSLDEDRNTSIRIGSALSELLSTGSRQTYNVFEFYDWALVLTGHNFDLVGNKHLQTFFPRRRIVSSAKGQVAYLKIFKTNIIPRRGYLTLSWARGILRYRDLEFEAAMEPLGTRLAIGPPYDTWYYDHAVASLCNLSSECRMVWRATPHARYLELSAVCRDKTGQMLDILVQPFTILENIALSLFIEGCQHLFDKPLDEPDQFALFTGPLFNHSSASLEEDPKISCVAVDGDNGLRMLAFGAKTAPFPMVFRGSACLACGLQVCRKAQCRVLIL